MQRGNVVCFSSSYIDLSDVVEVVLCFLFGVFFCTPAGLRPYTNIPTSHTTHSTSIHTHCTSVRGDGALCGRVGAHANTQGAYVPLEEMIEREGGNNKHI
jgi:hypothetical protein